MIYEEDPEKGDFVFTEYDARDEEYLQGKAIRYLRISGSKVAKVSGQAFEPASHCYLQSAARLKDLSELDLPSLELDSCRSIERLPVSTRLRRLEIRACGRVVNLDFLRDIPNLECLHIAGRNCLVDLGGLIHARALKIFWCSCPKRMLLPIAKEFPYLVISNTSWVFEDGEIHRDLDRVYEVSKPYDRYLMGE